ncbi:MAG TPA: SCO family protein [Acidimicrobiaceae bacterium]|mgnify:CR=1 FL=1|nr:SCO family protein [Acidimicrobiaceae bacterium]
MKNPLDSLTRRRVVLIALSAVAVLAIGITVAVMRSDDTPDAAGVGVALAEPLQMPSAILTDTDGNEFDLRADTVGKATLLYFGYTHCPDACPIHMAVLADVMETLQPEVRDQIQVIFVTTDPVRDTPEILREYLANFDPSFIGLSGSDETLYDLQVAAGVPVAVAEPMDDNGGYLIGHATQVIAFDPTGVATEVYPFGVRQGDWAGALPDLVNRR